MTRVFILFLFLVPLTKSENYPNNNSIKNKTLFLKQFLEYLQRPVQVYGYFCWRKDQIRFLQKELSDGFFPSRFFTALEDFNGDVTRKKAITFFVDLTCDHAKRMLIKANENMIFRKAHTLILFGNSLDELTRQNRTFSFSGSTFFVRDTDSDFKVTKIYKNSDLSQAFLKVNIGMWSSSKMTFLKSYIKTKTNFNGGPIRVSYALTWNESILHLTDYRQPDRDIIPKMIYLLMSNVAYFLNATHEPTFRQFWGNYDSKTGSYTPGGMFADLQQGQCDIAGNSALITHERLKVFRYLAADTTPDMISWFFRAPRLMSTKNIWILPFTSLTWYAVCSLSIVGGIIFSAVVIIENKHCLNKHREHRWNDIIFDTTTAFFTQRGTSTEFVSWSGKLAFIIFALQTQLVYIAFSAQFVVLLQSPNNKISSFDELLKSNMDIGAEDAIYNKFYFTEANDIVDESLRLKIFMQKIKGREADFFLNETSGMEKVRQGYFAFHLMNPTAHRIIKESYNEYESRAIRTIRPITRITKVFLCVPKNSPMEDFISIGLLRLHETGIRNIESLRLFPSKPVPDYSSTSPFVSLGLKDIYYLYLGLSCGIIASLVVLLLERMYYSNKIYRRNNKLLGN